MSLCDRLLLIDSSTPLGMTMRRGHFDRVKRVEKSIKTAQSGVGMGEKSHPQAALEAATLSQYIHKFTRYAILRIDFVWLAGAFGYSDVLYEGLHVGRGRRGKARYR